MKVYVVTEYQALLVLHKAPAHLKCPMALPALLYYPAKIGKILKKKFGALAAPSAELLS